MKNRSFIAAALLIASLAITACGGSGAPASASDQAPASTEAAVTVAETAAGTEAVESAEAPETADIAGFYGLESFMGLSGDALKEMFELETVEDVRKSFSFDIRKDGTAVFDTGDGDPTTLKWTSDGDKITFASPDPEDAETLEGTVSDGVLQLSLEGVDIILAREDGIEKARSLAAKTEQ